MKRALLLWLLSFAAHAAPDQPWLDDSGGAPLTLTGILVAVLVIGGAIAGVGKWGPKFLLLVFVGLIVLSIFSGK